MTLTIGTPHAQASDLAVAIPTRRAPTRPGPDVTATALSSVPEIPASVSAWVDDRRDQFDVGATGQLRYHSAELGVEIDLARHDG